MGPAPFRSRIGYLAELDGFRAIAVVSVMLHHAIPQVRGGFLGVDAFFVLSGFLITSILLAEHRETGTIHLSNFYCRRLIRLYPALLAMTGTYLVVHTLATDASAGAAARAAVAAVTYTTNWALLFGVTVSGLGHTWSLAVEEQFYLLWPPLLITLLKVGVPRPLIVVVTVALIDASAAARMWLWSEASVSRVYTGLDTRVDHILLGCLLGMVTQWNLLPFSARWNRAIGVIPWVAVPTLVAFLLFAEWRSSLMYHGLGMVAALAFLLLLVHILNRPTGIVARCLRYRILVWTGSISYGLYLWHLPVFHGVRALARDFVPGVRPAAIVVIQFTAAFLIAALCYRIVERPVLRFRRRFGAVQ